MSIGKWFKSLSLRYKLLLVYVVLAVLPVLAVTAYNYRQTKDILLSESYQVMYQNIERTEKSIRAGLDAYAIIMDLLYTNQMLNSYLNVDYTNLSYWDMFQYIDQQLGGILVINQSIAAVSFYGSNETLPWDNYYFYSIEDLQPKWLEATRKGNGKNSAVGTQTEKGRPYLYLSRLLNYYSTGQLETVLLLKIDAQQMMDQLQQSADTSDMYLVSETGEILASSVKESFGGNMDEITKEWKQVPLDLTGISVEIDGVEKLCMARETGMETRLLLVTDQNSLIEKAGTVTREILFIFFASSILMIGAIWGYSEWMSRRVDKVVYAAKKLGEGEFDYRLREMGEDEIGLIAKAFNGLNDRLQVLIAENYEKRLLIKSSEMNLLQEQINPHFLYNALSVISSMAMREGGKQTLQSIRYLADFYRISLSKGKQVISVQEELALLQNYMKIQQIRFGDNVEIAYDAQRQVLQNRTIKLLLQPLVENAIHHGRGEEDETLHIRVRIFQEKERVIFEVEDDGVGIEPEKLVRLRGELKQHQEGYGLKNVDIRVKLHYGEDYGVAVHSVYGKGTTVKVEIPVCPL